MVVVIILGEGLLKLGIVVGKFILLFIFELGGGFDLLVFVGGIFKLVVLKRLRFSLIIFCIFVLLFNNSVIFDFLIVLFVRIILSFVFLLVVKTMKVLFSLFFIICTFLLGMVNLEKKWRMFMVFVIIGRFCKRMIIVMLR